MEKGNKVTRRFVVIFTRSDGGGPSDKLYDYVIAPSCEHAGFQPYPIDRDPEATVSIEVLRRTIRESAACIADLTSNNPSVYYGLGSADTLQKDVILILNGKKLPLDVRHRNVVFYRSQAPSGSMQTSLVDRLRAIDHIAKQDGSPNGHDLKVLLALLCSPKGLTEYDISQFLGESGIQVAKTILSVREMERLEYISGQVLQDFDGDPLRAFKLTEKGLEWLHNNREE